MSPSILFSLGQCFRIGQAAAVRFLAADPVPMTGFSACTDAHGGSLGSVACIVDPDSRTELPVDFTIPRPQFDSNALQGHRVKVQVAV